MATQGSPTSYIHTDEVGYLRNRKKEGSREPIVRVLSEKECDLASYFSCPKSKDAVWVNGLSPQDEIDEIEFIKEDRRRKEEKAAKILVIALGKNWLLYPNIIGFFFLGVLLVRICILLFSHDCVSSFTQSNELEEVHFIYSSETFFPLSKQRGEGIVEFFFRVAPILCPLPVLFASLYALCLTLQVGLSTHHFSALCALGCAVLYFLAAGSQYYAISSTAASLSSSTSVRGGHTRGRNAPFKDVPEELLSLYYLLMIVKYMSLLISLILVSPSVAMAMGKAHFAWLFRALLAIPLLIWCVYLFSPLISSEFENSPPVIHLSTVYGIMLVSWGTFICMCIRHKKFELPFFSPFILEKN